MSFAMASMFGNFTRIKTVRWNYSWDISRRIRTVNGLTQIPIRALVDQASQRQPYGTITIGARIAIVLDCHARWTSN